MLYRVCATDTMNTVLRNILSIPSLHADTLDDLRQQHDHEITLPLQEEKAWIGERRYVHACKLHHHHSQGMWGQMTICKYWLLIVWNDTHRLQHILVSNTVPSALGSFYEFRLLDWSMYFVLNPQSMKLSPSCPHVNHTMHAHSESPTQLYPA